MVTFPCGEPDNGGREPGLTSCGGETVLDVRALPQPGPFVAILRHIEQRDRQSPQSGAGFTVRLARDPVFLYPELVERGWTWETLPSPPGEVTLRLRRCEGGDRK